MPPCRIPPSIRWPTAAKIVCELQTIVAREVDPLEPAVVSVTTVHGGDAHNVIPQSVKMTGTVRSLSLPGLRYLQQRVREVSRAGGGGKPVRGTSWPSRETTIRRW